MCYTYLWLLDYKDLSGNVLDNMYQELGRSPILNLHGEVGDYKI